MEKGIISIYVSADSGSHSETVWVQGGARRTPHRNQLWLLAFLCVGLACAALYQFAGIPVWLARATGLARSHAFGMEIFTGAVQMLVFGVLLQVLRHTPGWSPRQSLALSGLWVSLLTVRTFYVQLNPLAGELPSAVGFVARGLLAMLLALGLSYLFLRGRICAFVLAYCGMICAVSLPFNPLYLAATSLTPLTPALAEPLRYAGRTLLLNMTGQNHLWAAGKKVLNTTQFYCDMSIYNMLYPGMPDYDKYQKYNFMECRTDSASPPLNYELSYSPDVNHIVFDKELYDFSQLPIDSVIIPAGSMSLLKKNKSLRKGSLQNGLALFRVIQSSAD